MHIYQIGRRGWLVALAACLLLFAAAPAQAYLQGLDQSALPAAAFNLRAKSGYISTADGSSLFFWGYSDENSRQVQYPGPTLIVMQGQTVTVTLANNLSEPVSIVFPGQQVTATGGVPGLLTREAPTDRVTKVTYTFVAERPGTFTYYSGSHSDLQVEMGLIGALIVRPTGYMPMDPLTWTAYGDARSAYDHEYLFLQSEMDPVIHDLVEFGQMDQVETTAFWPVLWFINGRNAPDTMGMNCDPNIPTQPYNIMPMINPGQRLLLRVIGGGRDLHPFHTHGNNMEVIARDAFLLTTDPAVGAVDADRPLVPNATATFGTVPDLAFSDFTLKTAPGATYDAIFTWTGMGMGWDIYGDPALHDCTPNPDGYDAVTLEYCDDHELPFPVTLPSTNVIALGATYSGSPFLGAAGFLPPGEGGNNPNGGYFFMWHSHNEKEMVNYDIFPGGLMTMMVIEPPGIMIDTMPMGVCP
jgi:FtsP/CotA-like multicopper oxidase with cupredoxin domain